MEQVLVLKGIMVLGKGHGSGVEPAVDDLRHPVHLFSALGAGDDHVVDKWTVELHLSLVAVHFLTVFLYHIHIVGAHFLKLFPAADAVHMAALTLPYGKRSSPVTVSGDAPVLDILQPVAEPAFSDGFRDPVDHVVIADQILLHGGHLDEPGFTGIVDQRSIAAPAMGIAVLKYGSLE